MQIPGINEFDANGFHAHNCGEQPLPPYGSCLLGSVNLTRFVKNAFTDFAEFDWNEYREVVKVFTRMLDNVCEINGLPLEQQRNEIMRKRRHGMGFLGLGSTITCLGMKYGAEDSIKFTEDVSREMAVAGWEAALELAKEKGPAPIMKEEFTVTAEMLRKRPEMAKDGWKVGDLIPGRILHARYSRYMQRVAETAPWLVDQLANVGARFTHHSSIAPTGTISLSLANNASNGIEPSFAHHYFRNVIRPGKKTKEKVDVFSFELLAYRELINPRAMPNATNPAEQLPGYFTTADDITPKEHVDIQAAAQRWVDSSISKTANVPTDYKYESFKDIYLYAHEKDLKGCTTFRFNPEAFQGVLVKEDDLKNTTYVFTLDDGSEISVKGDEEIEYDGEKHTAANLYDALKEGYYGKFLTGTMAAIKIDKKISKYRVQKPATAEEKAAAVAAAEIVKLEPAVEMTHDRQGRSSKVVRMTEEVQRPEMLVGSTYKIKTPVSDHAMYVTINDIILNEDTPYEQRRPFEIFINSKNLDHFQWIVALTRIISAVFRKGGDVTFLVDELKAVFDPRGGYWQAGGKFMPSIIAELGYVIEKHLQTIGLLKKVELDEHAQKLIAEKKAEFVERTKQTDAFAKSHFPEGAQLCAKCSTAAVVMMDGCMTCLNCGDSKCG